MRSFEVVGRPARRTSEGRAALLIEARPKRLESVRHLGRRSA
jgi:hypothetical protein